MALLFATNFILSEQVKKNMALDANITRHRYFWLAAIHLQLYKDAQIKVRELKSFQMSTCNYVSTLNTELQNKR